MTQHFRGGRGCTDNSALGRGDSGFHRGASGSVAPAGRPAATCPASGWHPGGRAGLHKPGVPPGQHAGQQPPGAACRVHSPTRRGPASPSPGAPSFSARYLPHLFPSLCPSLYSLLSPTLPPSLCLPPSLPPFLSPPLSLSASPSPLSLWWITTRLEGHSSCRQADDWTSMYWHLHLKPLQASGYHQLHCYGKQSSSCKHEKGRARASGRVTYRRGRKCHAFPAW